MQIGGPAESYMDAPVLSGGGGGGKSGSGTGGFIANILNLLGIEKTVAQGGDSAASKSGKGKSASQGTAAAATAAIPTDKTAMQNGAMYDSHGAAAASGFLAGLGHGLSKGSLVQAPIAPPGLTPVAPAATPSYTASPNPFLGSITPIQIIDPNTVYSRP